MSEGINQPASHSPSVTSSVAPSRLSPPICGPSTTQGPSPPVAPAASSITVVVRKRPKLPNQEQDENDVVRCSEDGRAVVVYEPRMKLDLTPFIEPSSFTFDHVFDEKRDNCAVYEDCCRPLLQSVREGGGAVVFAFGQTGSGKTYTMLGDQGSPGLYGLAVMELLDMTGPTVGLSASFYEVYGSKLYDLLNDRTEIKMLQDEYRNVHIVGLSEREVNSVDDVEALMTSGQQLRAIGTTHANDRSSRSHAVLEIKAKPIGAAAAAAAAAATAGNGTTTGDAYGRITFVDLAGSERASDTSEADAKTRREGAEINKSLLALKECIRAMSMRKRHIPFRGSKLTQILRESFTGRCRTCVIATISPCQSHCEDTLNTLRYADRIKELKGPAGGGAGAAGLQTPTPCRNCGLPIFVGDRHVCRRQIAECPHCRKEMDKNELEVHLSECKEVPLRCPHCNERMLRADLPRHNRRCFRLPVRCVDCGQSVPRNMLEKHTLNECSAAKERCRHCSLLFPRQVLASHEGGCDAMRVACPFCLKYIRQRRLDAHTAMCFLNPNRAAANATTTTSSSFAGPSPATQQQQQQQRLQQPPLPQQQTGASGSSGSLGKGRARRRASDPTPPSGHASREASVSLERHNVAGAGAAAPSAADGLSLAPPLPVSPSSPTNTTTALGTTTTKYHRAASSLPDATAVTRRRARRREPPSLPRVVGGEYQTSTFLGNGSSGCLCPYARFGCRAKVSPLSLPSHLSEAVEEHLRLVTSYADSVDSQNAELRRLVVSGNR